MKNNILFGVITILLVAVIVFCSVQTVTAQRTDRLQIDMEVYEKAEDEYTKEVRAILNTWYIPNAGIAMTKVIDTDGAREYKVTIHHERIHKFSSQKKAELNEELAKLVFPLPDCKVSYEFITV